MYPRAACNQLAPASFDGGPRAARGATRRAWYGAQECLIRSAGAAASPPSVAPRRRRTAARRPPSSTNNIIDRIATYRMCVTRHSQSTHACLSGLRRALAALSRRENCHRMARSSPRQVVRRLLSSGRFGVAAVHAHGPGRPAGRARALPDVARLRDELAHNPRPDAWAAAASPPSTGLSQLLPTAAGRWTTAGGKNRVHMHRAQF